MNKPDPIDEEFTFEGRVIISETDLKGNIIYANRKFCEISGYSSDELVGLPHSIIRHPDMPKGAFEKMWDTIKGGTIWHGLVKNLRKDGLFYWVETEISPIRNEEGETTGYIAARKHATKKDIEQTAATYATMLENEK